MTLVWITLGVAVWVFIGCGVLAWADNANQDLFKWASSGPPFGYSLVLLAWPWVVYRFRRESNV